MAVVKSVRYPIVVPMTVKMLAYIAFFFWFFKSTLIAVHSIPSSFSSLIKVGLLMPSKCLDSSRSLMPGFI